MTERTALDAQQLRLLAWLHTPDARAAARSDLHRVGLEWYDPDDLLHDVAVRLLRAELPNRIDNPVGYARRSIQLRTTDLLRGDLVRDRHAATVLADHDQHDDAAAHDVPDLRTTPPDEVAVGKAVEDGVRRALHVALVTTKAWVVAAALSTLTLRLHQGVQVPEDVPRPDVADEDKADRWAALWLAGEADVFPGPHSGRTDGPAVRKARSRKLQEVEHLLRSVAASVLGEGGTDG